MKSRMDYLRYYSRAGPIIDLWTDLTPFQRYIHERRMDCIISEMNFAPDDRILDAGCGDGLMLIRLAKQASGMIIGMDISFPVVSRLRERLSQKDRPVRLFQGDLRFLPLRENSIGVIISKEVLEHLENEALKYSLSEFYRLLRPGGALICEVPFKEVIKETTCIHCSRKTPLWGHLQSFSGDDLKKTLQEIGFTSIRMKKIISLPNYLAYGSKICLRIGQKMPFALWNILDSLGTAMLRNGIPGFYPILLINAIK